MLKTIKMYNETEGLVNIAVRAIRMKLVTSTLRLTLYLILFSTTSTYAGVLGISDVEVEKALKGTGVKLHPKVTH